MAYTGCSIAQVRANDAKLTIANGLLDAIVTDRIAQTDKIVKTDLKSVIDFSLITIDYSSSNFPDFLNLLSQYKAVELSLIYMYGKKREAENNADIDYWNSLYNWLRDKILAGEIPLELVDGTSISGGTSIFSNVAKPDIEPALGLGTYGSFKNKADLEDERPIE